MRKLLTLALVGLCLTACKSNEPDGFYIPDTISGAAQTYLRNFSRSQRDQQVWPPSEDVEGWRKLQETLEAESERRFADVLKAQGVQAETATLGGVAVLRVLPPHPVAGDRVLVYLHGGAYVIGSARSCLANAALMAKATGLPVLSVNYTLAPGARWQQVTDQVVAVYRALLESGLKGEHIGFYGDSAGGGLASGAILKARDQGLPLPGALVLWSGWTDISETGDTYQTLREAEPCYTYANLLGKAARGYAPPEDWQNPYVSAVYGQFAAGYSPSLIQCGTKEIFLSNSVRFYQALRGAGQEAVLDVYEGMPHDFQCLEQLPEAELARRRSADFLTHQLGL